MGQLASTSNAYYLKMLHTSTMISRAITSVMTHESWFAWLPFNAVVSNLQFTKGYSIFTFSIYIAVVMVVQVLMSSLSKKGFMSEEYMFGCCF